jgi:hypothetical protein
MTCRCFIYPFIILVLYSCQGSIKKPNSVEVIADPTTQKVVFNNLVSLTNNIIQGDKLNDSLAFLVLPVKISCPACRKKTIDSIVKHKDDLMKNHFIIISSSDGIRTIGFYFKEVNHEMPVMENQLLFDTTHRAYENKLVEENPVMYYTANRKAYKKVSAIPATVKDDLREFFSGTRNTGNSE